VVVAHGTAVGCLPPAPRVTERSWYQPAMHSSCVLIVEATQGKRGAYLAASRGSSKPRRLLPAMGVFRLQKSQVELS
jgi:hypothetical protein